MKYSLKKTELICCIIAAILGTIFHFVYKWSGENPVAGLFFPVNESTWEHPKLVSLPSLLRSICGYFTLQTKYTTVISVTLLPALTGMDPPLAPFYTYTGVYGKNSDVMNILIYFAAMAAAYRFSYQMLRKHKLCSMSARVCYVGFMVLVLLFVVFTIFPPPIGLFAPPL